MTRKELYSKVKSMGLADEIKSLFGKNFTTVSNEDLEKVIHKHLAEKPKCAEKQSTKVKELAFKDIIIRIVSTLQGNKLIDATDAEFIMQGLY